MPVLVFIIFALFLPAAEIYLYALWLQSATAPALAWLAASSAGGWWLMRRGRAGVGAALRALSDKGGNPAALLGFGRLWLVGFLLLLPGLLSDGVALFVLLWPGRFLPPPDIQIQPSEKKRQRVDYEIVDD